MSIKIDDLPEKHRQGAREQMMMQKHSIIADTRPSCGRSEWREGPESSVAASVSARSTREQVEVPVHIPTLDGKAVAETIMVKVEGIRDAKTGELFLDGNALELLDKAKARYIATFSLRPTADEAKLNQTERLFYAHLKHIVTPLYMGVQSITLKLADDCRYTPDFWAVIVQGTFTFYEVKGFWRDDARVKIKVAARTFPWAEFVAVQRIKKEWKFENIKP